MFIWNIVIFQGFFWVGVGGWSVVYIIMFYINLLQIHFCCHICSSLSAVYLCKPMSMQCDFSFTRPFLMCTFSLTYEVMCIVGCIVWQMIHDIAHVWENNFLNITQVHSLLFFHLKYSILSKPQGMQVTHTAYLSNRTISWM